MAHTKILLREDVDDLGARGEIVRVRSGYARNYLLPRKLAVQATAGNVKQIERERAVLLKKEAGERATADAQSEQMRSLVLNFERKSGEQGALYGSVTSMDIAEALKEKGYEIDRHRIHLREPLKRTGDFIVPLRLHREVTVDLRVKVSPEGQVIVGHMTPEQEAELTKRPESDTADESAD
ncbi:MAG: 50S ribosomal protein L9 [Pyrinomonadaceae bacterium]|jgi:large subunit ribosomal protein L9|nr:50S ribosomal protein L9 [Pyrinomonadaceae bacterium]MBA3570554.1 50S ribosomal protein L9 [Pyrinomonadaceae bacterium]MDQ3172497.1 50S ribosomal protein L9 [Acidobacteriota bacterium]